MGKRSAGIIKETRIMQKLLDTLQSKNPRISIHSVNDPAFRRFGRVVNFDASALIAVAEQTEMPKEGCKYLPDMPELETQEIFPVVQNELRGQGSCQIGMCWGSNSRLNCLEYHRSSEHNIAVTDFVLFLAAQQDMDGFDLPADAVSAFLVPKGTVIEVYATTLHFCPCQIDQNGFKCIVVLPRGTNLPLTGDRPVSGDGRLLWAKDKWLIAHPEAPHVGRGAYPGIHGENLVLSV